MRTSLEPEGTMLTKRLMTALVLGSVLAVACDTRGLSYGDPNSIIAVMSSDLWEDVSETVYGELEQTIVTVRDEKAFTVTYQEPYAEFWQNLRRFRQMLLVGTLSDPWIQEAVEASAEPITSPGLYRVRDVWSLDQAVTLVIGPEGGTAAELEEHLPAIHARLDSEYRAYARERMYLSGVDSALADTLATEAGFSLLLPNVYRWIHRDSTFVFRNDNPDPSELIRQVGVTWRSPAPASLDADEVLAWRADLAASHYTEPQEFVAEEMTVETVSFGAHAALEIRAQWRNPPDRGWPAGGPLIMRVVTCDSQDRTYLLDAWLYAPGHEKYEYMIQLETLLDTFDCG
jgi:hypothetical protein